MRMISAALIVASCVMTVGCAPRTIVKVDHCTGWAPILVAPADVLTDGTARMILAHDLYGARMGCWPTPARAKPAPKP